jgi:hypothetical protein
MARGAVMSLIFKSKDARVLHELMKSYVSIAEDVNCLDDGLVVRAGDAIALFDDMVAACRLMADAYASDGNTKRQKAAHSAIRAALLRADR